MAEIHLSYPENVISVHRIQYCPLCTTPLVRKVIFDDNLPRVTCPKCGWIQLITNAIGVVVVARDERGIAAILPPGKQGAALPAGLIEYGEAPEQAALREVYEETGLEARIVRCMGWLFAGDIQGWPGPLIYFMYEAEITRGELKGSAEGEARIFPLDEFPPIVPGRRGSKMAMRTYQADYNERHV